MPSISMNARMKDNSLIFHINITTLNMNTVEYGKNYENIRGDDQ